MTVLHCFGSIKWTVQKLSNIDRPHLVLLNSATKKFMVTCAQARPSVILGDLRFCIMAAVLRERRRVHFC